MTVLASPSRERRKRALLPNGEPRYVRCYDNGASKDPTFDCYTIVFTRKKNGTGPRSEFLYLGASEHPFHPQGFGQHGSSQTQIDYPTYGHLGKKVKFSVLPPDVQRFVRSTYCDLWEIQP